MKVAGNVREHILGVLWALPFVAYLGYCLDYREPRTITYRVLTPEILPGQSLSIGTMTRLLRIGCDVETTIWRVTDASEVKIPIDTLGVTPQEPPAADSPLFRRVSVPMPQTLPAGPAYLRIEQEAKCAMNPFQAFWPIRYEPMIVRFVVRPSDAPTPSG